MAGRFFTICALLLAGAGDTGAGHADAEDAGAGPGAGPAVLVCGERAGFVRDEAVGLRIAEALESIVSWLRRREQERVTGQDPAAIHGHATESTASDGVRVLVELTGIRCTACEGAGSIAWEEIGDDLELWRRFGAAHGPRSRAERLDAQRVCATRFLNERLAALEAFRGGAAAGAPAREPAGGTPLPPRMRLGLSARAGTEVSLRALARREAWTAGELDDAIGFARRLQAFLDRGTREAWRAVFGMDEAAYARAVDPDGPRVQARAAAVREQANAYARRTIDFLDDLAKRPPAETTDEAIWGERQRLQETAGKFMQTGFECPRVRVVREGEDLAVLTLCLPAANLWHPSGLAPAFWNDAEREKFRAEVATYDRQLAETASAAVSGPALD